MTSEPEAEDSDVASAMASDSGDAGSPGTLLEVTFQRNPRQKYKYLEAEPKILGVTEIALAVFFIGCRFIFYIGPDFIDQNTNNTMLALCSVGIIAGSVAIAAQKLHLPTLKACLGMQVVTCVAYTLCLLFTPTEYTLHEDCWNSNYSGEVRNPCLLLENGLHHIASLAQLTAVTQMVLSITLAAYCCKVIPCCTARSHVPVLVMTPPTAPQ